MSSDTETSYSESQDQCELKKKCESCESSFHIFKRKRQCFFCKLCYCRNCVEFCFLNTNSETNNESNQNRKLKRYPINTRTCRACANCIAMSSSRTTYNQLMSIDVKYLKLFLTNSNTPGVENLTEKTQFVDLLISKLRNESPTNSTQGNSVNLVESELIEETNQKYLKFKASLSDLSCLDDIEKLNNKRIKQILASNFVHFKSTSNRSELVGKLKSLYLTNEENKQLDSKQVMNVNSTSLEDTKSSSVSHDLCKICMEYVIDCVLLDCGHMLVPECNLLSAKQINDCPICRSEVMKIIRVFKS